MKRFFISLSVALFGLAPIAFVGVPAYADSKTQVCQGIGLTGTACGTSGSSGVTTLIRAVINILSIIVGIAAVIMIIIGGLKYVTSNGDSAAISSAKSTIIYALVGLVVALLAQFLVHYVITNVS